MVITNNTTPQGTTLLVSHPRTCRNVRVKARQIPEASKVKLSHEKYTELIRES